MERRASPPVHHSSLQSKAIQKRKIAGNERKPPHNQQNPQRDQQASARDLHSVHVEFEAIIKLQKAFNAKRSQQERHRQSGRINRQKKNPLPNRILSGGESQHHGEDRTDAWCPSKSKCKANHKRSPRRRTAFEPV